MHSAQRVAHDFGAEAIAGLVMLGTPELEPPAKYLKEAELLIDQTLPEGPEKYHLTLRQNARVTLASLGGLANGKEITLLAGALLEVVNRHINTQAPAAEEDFTPVSYLESHLLEDIRSRVAQTKNFRLVPKRIDADEYSYLKDYLKIEIELPPSIDALVARMHFADIDDRNFIVQQKVIRGNSDYVRMDLPDENMERMAGLLKEQRLKFIRYKSHATGVTSIRIDLRPLARDPEGSRHSARVIAQALDNPSSGFHKA